MRMNWLRRALPASIYCAAAIVATGAGFPARAATPTPVADTVYLHGDVITVDERQPNARAIAVKDGRILAVGGDEDIQRLRGADTRVVDLAGRTLLPGFVDGHSHIGDQVSGWGLPDLAPPPVGKVASFADMRRVLGDYLASHPMPADAFVAASGYDDSLLAEKRHPTRADLDPISGAHPLCVFHVSGHVAVCNTLALRKVGFAKGAPDPKGGTVRRDADGEPNGIVEEQALFAFIPLIPRKSPQQLAQDFLEVQRYYAGFGYTTAQDGQTLLPATFNLLLDAQKSNTLLLDIISYPKWNLVEKMMAERGIHIGHEYDRHLKFQGVKITEDGSPQGKTAYLSQPYFKVPAGQGADYRGYPVMSQEELDRWYDKFYARGWQVQTHCNGDACIDMVLAALRKAQAKYHARDDRPVIVHSQVMRREQLDTYKTLGVVPTFFPAHTFFWGDWHRDETLGPARAAFISPTGSAEKLGIRFSIHSDAPVVPPNAMQLWWSAVNRVTRSGQVLGADQRLTPMQALRALTIDAAYQQFDEAIKGSISVGKLADFVILADNPLRADPMKIKDIAVLETIKEDKTIFKRAP